MIIKSAFSVSPWSENPIPTTGSCDLTVNSKKNILKKLNKQNDDRLTSAFCSLADKKSLPRSSVTFLIVSNKRCTSYSRTKVNRPLILVYREGLCDIYHSDRWPNKYSCNLMLQMGDHICLQKHNHMDGLRKSTTSKNILRTAVGFYELPTTHNTQYNTPISQCKK